MVRSAPPRPTRPLGPRRAPAAPGPLADHRARPHDAEACPLCRALAAAGVVLEPMGADTTAVTRRR